MAPFRLWSDVGWAVRAYPLDVPVAAVPLQRGPVPPWLTDLAFFLLAVGLGAVGLLDGVEQHLDRATLTVDAVLGGASCAGIWIRRSRPVAFAMGVGVFSVWALSASLISCLALFTVATHRRLAIVAPIVGFYALISPISVLVRPDMVTTHFGPAVLGVVVIAAILAWGMYVRARRELVASLHERALRAEAEQELRVSQARQAERARIAREMHDVLAHRISLLSLHAGALELRPDAAPDTIAQAAGVIRQSAHQVLEDLREVIGVLRVDQPEEPPEHPQPSLGDLDSLVDEARLAGCAVTLSCTVADMAAVPAGIGRGAYRIVQEGLTNARKHAPGQPVTVTVDGIAGGGLAIELINPVPDRAATTIPGSGTGLIGLAERAVIAGGSLDHRQTTDGFQLRAWLPWPS